LEIGAGEVFAEFAGFELEENWGVGFFVEDEEADG
jgi:hypothetical protein